MGEDPDLRDGEIASLLLGLDLGLTLIESSSTYGNGAAEELVGEAIDGRRDDVFLVTKVGPSREMPPDLMYACEQSLRRLGTDWIDLYLIDSRGFALLDEVLDAIARLVDLERIIYWGVANFGVADLEELWGAPHGPHVQIDQLPYNLLHRDVELDVLPWCRARAIPVLACSPLEHGELLGHPALRRVADRRGATAGQIALAWVLAHEGVGAVPRARTSDHVRENAAALSVRLTREDLDDLDRAFARPGAMEWARPG